MATKNAAGQTAKGAGGWLVVLRHRSRLQQQHGGGVGPCYAKETRKKKVIEFLLTDFNAQYPAATLSLQKANSSKRRYTKENAK